MGNGQHEKVNVPGKSMGYFVVRIDRRGIRFFRIPFSPISVEYTNERNVLRSASYTVV